MNDNALLLFRLLSGENQAESLEVSRKKFCVLAGYMGPKRNPGAC